MTSFISGPILQVQLGASEIDKAWQDVVNEVTIWSVINILEINSNDDQNIHWTRNQIFSILLDPGVVQGLDLSSVADINQIQLERVFDTQLGTESWRVL